MAFSHSDSIRAELSHCCVVTEHQAYSSQSFCPVTILLTASNYSCISRVRFLTDRYAWFPFWYIWLKSTINSGWFWCWFFKFLPESLEYWHAWGFRWLVNNSFNNPVLNRSNLGRPSTRLTNICVRFPEPFNVRGVASNSGVAYLKTFSWKLSWKLL